MRREAGEELDALETFRSDLCGFLRFYEFMSQVIDFDDADLEKLSVFGRNLLPMLPRDPEDGGVWLSQLLEKLNEISGSDLTNDDLLSYADTIRRKVEGNERVMQQVGNNPPAQVMLGDFPQAVVDAVVESGEARESLKRRVLEDTSTATRFAELLLELILKGASEGRRVAD